MQPHRVVPTLDVAKAGHLRFGLRYEPATPEQLGLKVEKKLSAMALS